MHTCNNGCKVYCANASGCCQLQSLIDSCKSPQLSVLDDTADAAAFEFVDRDDLVIVNDQLWDAYFQAMCSGDETEAAFCAAHAGSEPAR